MVIETLEPDIMASLDNLATNLVDHVASRHLYQGDMELLKGLKDHLNDKEILWGHWEKVAIIMGRVTNYCITSKHCTRLCKLVIKALFTFIVSYGMLLEKVKMHSLSQVLIHDYELIKCLITFYHTEDIVRRVYPHLICTDKVSKFDYLVFMVDPGHFNSKMVCKHEAERDVVDMDINDNEENVAKIRG